MSADFHEGQQRNTALFGSRVYSWFVVVLIIRYQVLVVVKKAKMKLIVGQQHSFYNSTTEERFGVSLATV